MSLKHLRTLIAIADHRTFSEAADSLCITHAAVSQHVGYLEDKTNVPLFDRSCRTPVLNATGRALVQRSRALLREYDSLSPSVLGKDTVVGDLQVGVVPTVLSTLVLKAILRLRTTCPGLRFQPRPGLTATLITSQELESDDVSDLLQTQPLIRFNREAVMGARIEAWLQSKRINVKEIMELSSLDSIASTVFANIGISIVSRSCATPFIAPPLGWLPLSNTTPRRHLALIYRKTTQIAWALDKALEACSASLDAREQPVNG